MNMPMKNPPHPGRIVRQECIEPLGLTVTDGAKALGVSRNALSELLNERRGISAEMAIRLSKAFGSAPETWAGLQLDYWNISSQDWVCSQICTCAGGHPGMPTRKGILMRNFFAFASVIFLLFSGSPAAAATTECKDIECSGRQIDCGNKSILEKPKCEIDKDAWKKKCEAKKAACEAVEKTLQ
jgi:antitoxin HigA-1